MIVPQKNDSSEKRIHYFVQETPHKTNKIIRAEDSRLLMSQIRTIAFSQGVKYVISSSVVFTGSEIRYLLIGSFLADRLKKKLILG